ncbi:hypothetical protein Godav_027006 [Gossypium davidsonii]|uniref:RNase H type-1 domain-containing protein n=1 Tax=Gossypium davidsonii TaxID=34287 RepID=A0A7J8RVH6_GOSDV|nr:hypothetical protein [Gossypium davidsonii]
MWNGRFYSVSLRGAFGKIKILLFSKENNIVRVRLSKSRIVGLSSLFPFIRVDRPSGKKGGIWFYCFRQSLKRSMSRRFDRVLIQTDSMEAMKAIQIFTKTSSKSALIRQIQQLLMKVGN